MRAVIAQTFIAIVCLDLLMWVGPAGAESVYELTVRRHRDVTLSNNDVDRNLADATEIMRKGQCNVIFKRKGPVQEFASRRTPKIIGKDSPSDRDAVHREDADVKVVKEIKFCRPGLPFNQFDGCAWPPRMGRRSMIVVQNPAEPFPNIGRLWAHEFGHRVGLRHRSDPTALMTGCSFSGDPVRISQDECECFVHGPGPGRCERRDPPNQCDR